MRFIADSHIHSHFSRATSKNLIPEYLAYWAVLKGIHVVGTGDCVHPGWLKELKEKLEPAGNGFFHLKPDYASKIPEAAYLKTPLTHVHFMLTTEISTIYKKNGKVRKVHHVCVFPNFESVEWMQQRLSKIGNIASDGRPILGMDSRNLLALILESSPTSFLIPAHIWTPWFSVLGSKSGFDSVIECFEDLTPHIFAVETGLSSDPPMNKLCSFLDGFRLVSNSDAHSPENLGREATLFDTEMSYEGVYNALRTGKGLEGTVEFFPQEGKYHYDGHRLCKTFWNPLETLEHEGLCPVCHKPVTKGVLYRVAELADRDEARIQPLLPSYHSITPLPHLLSEIVGSNPKSLAVQKHYFQLVQTFGSELELLLFSPLQHIQQYGSEYLAEGIRRLRNGQIRVTEGYDGIYGTVRVFDKKEMPHSKHTLFFEKNMSFSSPFYNKGAIEFDARLFRQLYQNTLLKSSPIAKKTSSEWQFSPEQRAAILHVQGPCCVLAGPGSGKTRILVERVKNLISSHSIAPDQILIITFSNKAAWEIIERLHAFGISDVSKVKTGTCHAIGFEILKEHAARIGLSEGFKIAETEMIKILLKRHLPKDTPTLSRLMDYIASQKRGVAIDMDPQEERHFQKAFTFYNHLLKASNTIDIDDLIYLPIDLFKRFPEILKQYQNQWPWVLVDEFQDLNAAQYEFIRLVAGSARPNLFAIGDPDQAIYGFQGADKRLFSQLSHDFPDIQILRLCQSYRCSNIILQIGKNVLNSDKSLKGKEEGIQAMIHECDSETSEAATIAAAIDEMIGGLHSLSLLKKAKESAGTAFPGIKSFSDIAILCRTSLLFPPLEKAIQASGIPYQIIDSDPFFKHEPAKIVIDVFRALYYHVDILLENKPSPIQDRMRSLFEEKQPLERLLTLLMDFYEIDKLIQKKILRLAKPFGNNYNAFLNSIPLRKGSDEYDPKIESVSLMTLHAAKGLEFPAIFIPACETPVIPFSLFTPLSPEAFKEEERLFYVGITRSQRYLYMTFSKKRMLKGRKVQGTKSPFLERIEKECIDYHQEIPLSRHNSHQLKLFT